MDDIMKEKMMKVMKSADMDESMLDNDMIMIMDDLAMDSEKLKKMLMEKGMDEMKTMEIMKKMANAMIEKEEMSDEDSEW